MTKDEIMRLVDDTTSPEKMTKAEAMDFLDELSADIEGRTDALREEMREAGELD